MIKHKLLKLASLAASLIMILTLMIPNVAYAQTWPDVEDLYFTSTGTYRVYDMDSSQVAVYRGYGFYFDTQVDNVVTGEVDIYEVGSIRGTYVLDGTGDLTTPRRLAEGNNNITVSANGTHQIILPAGVEAVATSGTATVTGSPLSLAEAGTRNIPTTTTGNFTLAINRVYTTIGTFSGVIGEGTRPRFQLIGTQIYATATQVGAVITGSPVKCIPANTTLNFTGAGTANITVPYGMVGTATSGTANVTGSPVTLPGGATTQITTAATTGTVTIGLQVAVGYNISGYLALNSDGDPAYMRGRFDGFLITDQVGWTTYQTNVSFKAKPTTRP